MPCRCFSARSQSAARAIQWVKHVCPAAIRQHILVYNDAQIARARLIRRDIGVSGLADQAELPQRSSTPEGAVGTWRQVVNNCQPKLTACACSSTRRWRSTIGQLTVALLLRTRLWQRRRPSTFYPATDSLPELLNAECQRANRCSDCATECLSTSVRSISRKRIGCKRKEERASSIA